jgi:hypothetical protein
MMFDTIITHYHFNNGQYTKTIIKEIFWDNVKSSNILKSGLVNADSTKILIKTDVSINFNLGRDLIVKGEVNYNIDNSTEQKISEGIKYLKDNFKEVVTVSAVDEKLFGGLSHIELSCK